MSCPVIRPALTHASECLGCRAEQLGKANGLGGPSGHEVKVRILLSEDQMECGDLSYGKLDSACF